MEKQKYTVSVLASFPQMEIFYNYIYLRIIKITTTLLRQKSHSERIIIQVVIARIAVKIMTEKCTKQNCWFIYH